MDIKINEYYKTYLYSGMPFVPPEAVEKASEQNSIEEKDFDSNENKRKISGVYKGDFFNHHNLK